ncbi:TetR family transcriptional regulator [Burkholderia pseudomallei]|uniref:TetR family transcriptional regulator n=1 Tax=Burkholderia pseudomallei TaxID=28450 RepID=UPI003F51C9A9
MRRPPSVRPGARRPILARAIRACAYARVLRVAPKRAPVTFYLLYARSLLKIG